VTTSRSLADRLFEAYIAFSVLEGELETTIDAWAVGVRAELEVGHDYYDGSVSIRGLPTDFVPTEEKLNELRDLGFKCCRLNGIYFSLVPKPEAGL
jgi:hypothetical protein